MTDELSTVRRDRVISWLRDLADRIEGGKLRADAATVILSEGDVHRPARIGYTDDVIWHHVAASLRDSHGASDPSPEDRAEWRAENERQKQAKQDAYDRAHPWRCACNQRFKTHRGWTIHRGAMRRRSARYSSTIVYGGSRSPEHEIVTEVEVADPEPPVHLFPQSS